VKVAAAGVDAVGGRVRPRRPGLTILLYHQVGGPRIGEVNLPTEVFDEQMASLDRFGRVVSLDDGLAALGAGVDRPLVAVTFDDGTAGFVDHALDVLVRHRVPATLYVATAWVARQRSFWDDGTLLSWAALGDALATGLVTVGSHSHDHLLFDRTPAAVLAGDLDRSVGLIGEHLGVGATHFAYPKALAPSPEGDAVVRARFTSAALAGCRANRPGVDPYRLARSPVQVSDTAADFARKAAGGLWFEDALRDAYGRVRYRRATR
jgi:peptidoglycan/xylan/chitin deacetylase (PgdA/CDA1 family)